MPKQSNLPPGVAEWMIPGCEGEEEDHAMKYYVNRYIVNRAYGGPEEGGWWYEYGIFDYTCPEGLYRTGDEDAALMLRDRLQEATDQVQDKMPGAFKYDLSSACCQGRVVWIVQTHPGRDYPSERPVYE